MTNIGKHVVLLVLAILHVGCKDGIITVVTPQQHQAKYEYFYYDELLNDALDGPLYNVMFYGQVFSRGRVPIVANEHETLYFLASASYATPEKLSGCPESFFSTSRPSPTITRATVS